MKDKFQILFEETNRILELNSKIQKKIYLTESTERDLTVTVKNETNELIPYAVVLDPDNPRVGGTTDTEGKIILKKFDGKRIRVNFVGYKQEDLSIPEEKNSVEVILKNSESLSQVEIVNKRLAKIQCVDSKSGEPIEGLKITLKNLKNDEDSTVKTDKNGIFSFDYSKFKTKVSVNNGTTYQSFDLTKKEKEEIPKDKVFKTIEFKNYIVITLQLEDSEDGNPIDVTEDLLNSVRVIADDDTAINKPLDVNKDELSKEGFILVDFPQTLFSDSTKLIIKLPGYLNKSIPLTSTPKGPIVVQLTKEVEEPERVKLPRGIRLGDVYESEELYDKMIRYLGLCGTKYQEK